MKNVMDRKIAIVTGGSRGIGKAISQRLIDDGFIIVVVHINCNENISLNPDGNWFEYFVDVSEESSVKGLFKLMAANFSKIDVLVNCAGICSAKNFTELQAKDFLEMFNVNTLGTFFMMREAIPLLTKAKNGKIINITSISGLQGFSTHAHYCASKFATHGLSQVAAKELAKFGITVNIVCPGPTHTSMWDKLDKEYSKINGWSKDKSEDEKYLGKNIIKRLGEPEDVACVVSMLASDDANYMTGISIPVCGGIVLR